HVRIGRFVAIAVPDPHEAPVAGVPFGFLDDAVARRHDRRPARRAPVDAGMKLGVAEDRVAARAETGGELAAAHRLAQQKLLRTLAGLVEIVDVAVVRCAETIEAPWPVAGI